MREQACDSGDTRIATLECLPTHVSLSLATFWTKIPFLQWGEVAKVKLRPLRWIKKILTEKGGGFQARCMSYFTVFTVFYFILQYYTVFYNIIQYDT
jgi:hypothetical protein